MPYEILRNDITRMKVDAIVNTANPRPVIGDGTDRAIHRAAGPELLEARRRIGDIAVGSAAATPAFRLHARYVLHTVGPVWQGGNCRERELLRKAYDAALNLALELRCRSVAFPLMGAGSYAFPHDSALLAAIQAISEFSLRHRMQIYLVLFDSEAFSAAGDLFADLKSYIDDNYAAEQERKERPDGARRRREDAALTYQAAECARENAGTALSVHAVGFKRKTSAKADSNAAMGAGIAPISGDLAEYLKQKESTFTEHLLHLLQEGGEKDSVVYRRAEISRQLFHKIISNRDYQPTKDTAVQLAIGLKLDLAQTQLLLGKAGYALTRSSKMDIVIQYYIERQTYNVKFINEALYDCGLPLLKTNLKK